ncbi:oligosaccharide flippase family protein, partial [Acinetobacter puyangensis]|uniref:oligosaccharide flippase family protein n=1 Tax=Acinetobacter puyangensis TaxID=1096779 RepID=UPI003A4E285A
LTAAICFTALFGFCISIRKYELKIEKINFNQCLEILKEDRYIFYSAIITNLYTATGIVLLGAFGSTKDVGFYVAAQSIVLLAQNVVLGALNPVFYPIFSKAFHESRDNAIELIKKIIPVNIYISLIVLVGMLVFGPFLILLMYGGDFFESILMFIILCFGLFLKFYGAIFGGQIMLNIAMDNIFVRIQIYTSILSVVLNTIGLYYFDLDGKWVAGVWVFSEFLITASQYFYLKYKGYSMFSWNMLRISSFVSGLKLVKKGAF